MAFRRLISVAVTCLTSVILERQMSIIDINTVTIVLTVVMMVARVASHGFLYEPPSRNAAWRVDPANHEPNYDDNEQNCGGFANQWDDNDGKCAICGDPYQGPYDHEAGGKYAKLDRNVTRCYNKADDVIDIHVVITSHHMGYFEFRLCEHNDMRTRADQSCFENGLLLTIHETGLTQYDINNVVQWDYFFKLNMPRDVTCTQCILQWKYNAGNNWGCDSTGCGMGLGKQENFVNCADIAILNDCSGSVTPPPRTSSPSSQSTPTPTPTVTISSPTTGQTTPTGDVGSTTSPGVETTSFGVETTSSGVETTSSGVETTSSGVETTSSGSATTSRGVATTTSGDASSSSLQFRSEWPSPWGSTNWVVALGCSIYLPESYSPQEEEKGFYIQLTLDSQATGIQSVFYPFDQDSVEMGEVGGKKRFLIKTSSNIWASQGQQDYEIHVAFTNKVTSAEGNWPRGTCSGPFSLDD